MLEINCPSCHSSNLIEDTDVMHDIDCITCGSTFIVEKIPQNIDENETIKEIKARLRERAVRQGGDAVINCTFDYRPSKGHSTFGASHDLEIFAYGTLVKRI